jgi:hypothetical protein
MISTFMWRKFPQEFILFSESIYEISAHWCFGRNRHTAAHKKTAAQPLLKARRRFMAFIGYFSCNICAPLL